MDIETKEGILKTLSGKVEDFKKELEKIDQSILSGNYSVDDLKKRSRLDMVVTGFTEYSNLKKQIEQLRKITSDESEEDAELVDEAQKELEAAERQINEKINFLLSELLPSDEDDKTDKLIMEVHAGAGGEEAGIFAFDLLEMYRKFAGISGLKFELTDIDYNDSGGIKSATAIISGDDVFKLLKFESGVHRVQRIPKTESQGRIHTSTATVAIMPEPKNVEIEIRLGELKIDAMRSMGSGGQSVNTTDSAIRITHLPTGIIITCQDEKSQQKNRDKAMEVLKTRLYNIEKERAEKERADTLKSQIGRGERGEKIRTYNFPQDRITDHRVQFSTNQMEKFMNGEIHIMIKALQDFELHEKISSVNLY